ncbi:MAG: hypothetical protein JW839_14205 [Candidatus Lokiarchaeota archaeon]|nr:hypothetical protein [Candidatus Lokiarchaeota archaeon]
MSGQRDREGKQAWLDLVGMLPYIEIDGKIAAGSLGSILERLDVRVDGRELKVKGIWHQFKQFHVYNMEGLPLFFIKELWQPEFLREIVGLHMAINYFDRELCPREYLFGVWKQEPRKEKPILITTYVKGQSLKKNQMGQYLFELGRQHALHQVLCLYDVDWRHFIVQQGILVRIDFGKALDQLTIPYQGFADLRWNELRKNAVFHDGVDYEFNRIKERVSSEKKHLSYFIDKIEAIGNYRNFFIDLDLGALTTKLRNYWHKYLPITIL